MIVVQGRKRGFHDGEAYVYDAQHYLVLAVPLPFEIETEASPDEPMLGLALRIDQTMTVELALAMNAAKIQPEASAQTMCSTPLNTRMSDATLRLLQALSSPLEARLLAPAVVREITFLVLSGPAAASGAADDDSQRPDCSIGIGQGWL